MQGRTRGGVWVNRPSLRMPPPPQPGEVARKEGDGLFNITSGDLLKTLWTLDFGASTLKAFYYHFVNFFFISSKFTKQTDRKQFV